MSFLQSIAVSPQENQKKKLYSKDPFRDLSPMQGGPAKLFGYKCTKTFIPESQFHNLKKYIEYIPLKNVCAHHSSKPFFSAEKA